MIKRIVTVLVAAALTLTSGMPGFYEKGVVALAAETTDIETVGAAVLEEGDFKYTELPNGTLKITRYKGNSTQVEIPSSIGGKAVVMIGDKTFLGRNDLTSIKIPASVTNIGESSASYYSSAEYPVFSECNSLTEIIVDSSNECYTSIDGILYNKEKTELFICPAGKTGNAEIANGITNIQEQAFYHCDSLASIKIPESVTNIIATFSDCSSLNEFIVDSGNTTYGAQDGILYGKASMSFPSSENQFVSLIRCPIGKKGTVTIPDGISSIGGSAFYNCENLTRINIPESVSSITDPYLVPKCQVFGNCSSLTDIAVDENNATYISDNGMLYTKDMSYLMCCPAGKNGSIEIPEMVTVICEGAFDGCSGLTDIIIGKNVVSIAYSNDIGKIFLECRNLKNITVNNGNRTYSSVDGILYNKDMSQLLRCPPGKKNSITVPDGVTIISAYAFYNCSYLNSITIPQSVTRISAPDDSIATFRNCKNLTEIIVDDKNKEYYSIDGILYKNSFNFLEVCPEGKEGNIIIPEGILSINYSAFKNCSKLSSIQLPDSLNEIDGGAFFGCSSLKSIELPEGLRDMHRSVFRDCTQLDRIYIPESVTRIADDEFEGCGDELYIICTENSYAKTYAIENGIRYELTENRKKPQFITASDFVKTFNDMPFLIHATSNGDGALTYESSDESIVSVSEEGIVVIKGAGTAQITITASETDLYKAAQKIITITVNDESDSGKEPQVITASNFTKTVGDMPFFIQAASDGDGILTYKSSNESVASVSEEGIIVIKGAGTAQITITASETDTCKAAEKVITVTVNPVAGSGQTPGNGQNTNDTGNSENNSDANADSIRETESTKAKIKSAKNTKSKSLTLKLNGLSDCDGYQIQYGLKKNFKGAKTITKQTGSVTIKKLKVRKTYYIRIRTYRKIAGNTYYGIWSSKKSVKIKK